MAVDTPAGHIYTGNGNTRVFPIPTRIIGDDYVRIELDGVYLSDRTQWDIVNNSIIFITAPANGTVVNIKVATSEEALAVLGSSTNVDIVATNMTDVNTVANNIEEVQSAYANAVIATTKANEASISASAAATSASTASTKATEASASASSANASASTAVTKANEASASASTATTKASEASASATSASTSASTATTKAAEAVVSASEASTSASNALASEDTANKWAEENEDVEVEPGKYSAKHWAAKSTQAAQGDAINISYDNTGTSLVSTNTQEALTELDVNRVSHVPLSTITAYHIYNGSVEATNTVLTNGFGTTLYTGNGSTKSINTAIDMDTQWGNDASEKFGGLVWLKSRSNAISNILIDTIRGNKSIFSNETTIESSASRLTSFNNNGFTLSSDVSVNTNLATYASWNFQTTHRTSGTTNHGKAYTCHYNPFTGFTIVKYEGSGIAGHEIPHHLGRKLGFVAVKNLSVVTDWLSQYREGYALNLNTTGVEVVATSSITNLNANNSILGNASWSNNSTNQYIMYGWANSYFDEDNTLIGNYEVGVYQGTGAAGNKVKTRGKPAWLMFKRLDSTGSWHIVDNTRNVSDPRASQLYPNTSGVEYTGTAYNMNFNTDGFTLNGTDVDMNASGGQYLYMIVYDNDSGSGKSKYPRATDTTNLSINALVPYASGIDTNGSKVSIEYKNETITGLTLTQGKNYPYSKNDGTYGVNSTAPSYGKDNPLTGDFFNLKTLKWYNSSNAEITPRTYLDCVVYADHNGQVSYVEELPKTTYFDEVKANEFKGKNACTAYINFDLTTTSPTIRDKKGFDTVIRTSTGIADLYFEEAMDNLSYTISEANSSVATLADNAIRYEKYLNKITITYYKSGVVNPNDCNIIIFGGKNS